MREVLSDLEGWIPAHFLPAGLTSMRLYQALDIAEARLRPVTATQLLTAHGMLIRHAAAFNIKCDDAAVQDEFAQHCRNMPGALFEKGMLALLEGWRNDFRLPQPGALRELIVDEWQKWIGEERKIRMALVRLKPAGDPPGERLPDDEVSRIVETARRALSSGAPNKRTR